MVEIADLKAELRITHDFEDTLIQRKIDAAKDYIENVIARKFEDIDGGPPAALQEAWLKLAAHLYEWRGAAAETSLTALPNGFDDLLRSYRWGKFNGEV